MRRLTVFNNISLDGYFTGAGGDLTWAYAAPEDREFNAFVEGNARGGDLLLLGRITYEMMAGYWPTALAALQKPVLAGWMNALNKVVFSRTMDRAGWANTRLVSDGLAEEIRRLKAGPGGGLTVLGSGSVVAQLAQAGLVDEYQLVVNPVVLGAGRTLFEGVVEHLPMTFLRSRTFANGCVLLCYQAG
jgi:dihydrofolate reductase